LRKKDIGRILRAFPPTARLLTEFRVKELLGAPGFADLGHCIRLAKPGSTAVDVGASVGNYALALRKAVGSKGRVLALEANPAVYKELVSSTWLSGVDARNLAASSTSGTAELVIPVDESGRAEEPIATLEPRAGRSVRVLISCARLDDLLRDEERVSVIKIDVEGHELDVLTGAQAVLERHRPALVVEIEKQHQRGHREPGDTVRLMTGLGYTCHAIHEDELIPWGEFDIERWQTRWLKQSEEYRRSHFSEYVNNFLFLHQTPTS
jgi:FkbM family methyltransferase